MTVGELIEALRAFPLDREVFVSQTSEDDELIDSPVTSVGEMVGIVFVSGAEE